MERCISSDRGADTSLAQHSVFANGPPVGYRRRAFSVLAVEKAQLCKSMELRRHPGSEGPVHVTMGYAGMFRLRGLGFRQLPLFGQEKVPPGERRLG